METYNTFCFVLLVYYACCNEIYRFGADINNLAIGKNKVYVATESHLYQLNHDLKLEIKNEVFANSSCTGSKSNWIKLLVVYEDNNTLIQCGTRNNGACEVRRLNNISDIILSDEVPVVPVYFGSAVGFLFKAETNIYLAVAAFRKNLPPNCRDDDLLPITVRDVVGSDIFLEHQAPHKPFIGVWEDKRLHTVHFVDGFQWLQRIYLFLNFNDTSERARIIIMETKHKKVDILNSFTAVTLLCCNDKARPELLSSSLIQLSGDSALWAGIFTAVKSGGPDTTALGVLNLSDARFQKSEAKDDDFCALDCRERPPSTSHKTIPIKAALVHSKMTSLATVAIHNWVVVFIGTGDGQLLKIVMDQNQKLSCPEILYESPAEKAVFFKMLLDPVDQEHIYMASGNELTRIKVANCRTLDSWKTCWSAQDPLCGWCAHENRCTLANECSRPDSIWVTIAEGSIQNPKQIFSYRLMDSSSDNKQDIHLTAQVYVNNSRDHSFTCQLTAENKHLCEKHNTTFPDCSCSFPKDKLSAEGLKVSVTFTIGTFTFSETVTLPNCSKIGSTPTKVPCSDCVSAGCSWSVKDHTCSTSSNPQIVSPGQNSDLVCRFGEHETVKPKQESGTFRCSGNKLHFSELIIPVDIAYDKGGIVDNPNQLSIFSCFLNASGCSPDKQLGPVIDSIEPNEVSTLGKTNVIIKGKNFFRGTTPFKVLVKGNSDCKPQEAQILSSTETEIRISLPKANKDVRKVCVELGDGRCYGSALVTYLSLPSCESISPNVSWASGNRRITIFGTKLHLVDSVKTGKHSADPLNTMMNSSHISYNSPPNAGKSTISLVVDTNELDCGHLIYHPDPEFLGFSAIPVGNVLQITIKKKKDTLNITEDELTILAKSNNESCPCNGNVIKENDKSGDTSIVCTIACKLSTSKLTLEIKLGNFSTVLEQPFNYLWLLIIIPFFILFIVVVSIYINQRNKRVMSKNLSEQLELLESDIRNEIREGFAELQTDQTDLIEGSGTIPYLDYKHFAMRTFFPEVGHKSSHFVNEVGHPFQDSREVKQDDCSKALSELILNKQFLVTLVQSMEEQKQFTIKDRCTFASYLTIALQSNLVYLTSVMEELLNNLMDQSSNAQPKLMLRRTESVVEKLLTNWMSVCLYGFLRESVGEPLFLLVSAITQRNNKGPVDAIHDKALYTLNEDWLLWQARDFSTVKLKVSLQGSPESEGEAHISLDVNVLDCDTIGQAKEKILQSFKTKFGHCYQFQINDIDIEFENNGIQQKLQEVDNSSKVLENGVTMLNTIGHYKIPDGALIRVTKKKQENLSTQESIKDDDNYTTKYCHLIETDLQEVEDQQQNGKKRKKLKLKEVYLTKLLSTKVAIHSFVEKLFQTIWGIPNNKVPVAIKYFFDFLDLQAKNKMITDPDVLHIWKTNSLPLRFWVNILKNPQFVFDMEKSPHLDACLSVIAQAFMDSFSLSDQQLGKYAPTNKLLYAKDIPQYKTEVKAYYKHIQDLPEFTKKNLNDFLLEESKKHENEFNEQAAMAEIYKFITAYFDVVLIKLEQNDASGSLKQQLLKVKGLFCERKSCKWE
ncbi:plexin-C1-like isoform X2 [Acipenser ruthenus]|uniref:plexin-C1-like isoform X2 n=1 Tax=Acipenser ruthenus TaxID=7906 RepID=UPI0027409E14|nr:plexin-C1-like isoform X2 [Acipenser ruthenus]